MGSDGYYDAGQGQTGYYNDYSTQQNSNGYYNAGQGYSEPITETDYFQTFEGEEDPLTGMAADYVAGRNLRSSAEVNDATMLYSGKVSPDGTKVKKSAAAAKKTPLTKKQIAMLAGIIVLGVVAIVCGIMLFTPAAGINASVKEDVVLEAGTAITLDAFFDNVPMDAVFLTDISGIDITQPAVYQLKIGYGHNKVADVSLRSGKGLLYGRNAEVYNRRHLPGICFRHRCLRKYDSFPGSFQHDRRSYSSGHQGCSRPYS